MAEKKITIDIDLPVKMRDGTTLRADVYRPDNAKPSPVILMRTPYSKSVLAARGGSYFDMLRAAKNGFAVIIQDCRGIGESEGVFYPFLNEFNDGYDTVEWAAKQPWSSGKVGMCGPSYLGLTQWCAAVMQPPHLVCIFPGQIGDDLHSSLFYPGGAFLLEFTLSFAVATMSLLEIARQGLPPDMFKQKLDGIFRVSENWDKQVGFLPLKQYPMLKELGVGAYYFDWLKYRDDKEYWDKINWSKFDKVKIPAYSMTSWYDLWQRGALRNYTGMKVNGGSRNAKKYQKLLVGPWLHGLPLSNDIGQVDTGLSSSGGLIDFTGIQLRWFDYWLKGIDNGIMNEPPVRIFVMGENIWRTENEWPLTRAKNTKYYLHSEGKANSLNGDGIVNTIAPDKENPDVFLYDPRHPVPTKGGAMIGKMISPAVMGSFDQIEIEKRADVLVYTTSPLEKDLEVTGPVEVKLFASSTARDTDFTAKLVDVWPDGKAFNITDGIIRARYRDSERPMKPLLIEPNTVYEYKIDL